MAIIQATDENFDGVIAEGVFLIDFYTTHCGPCRALLPTLLEVEGAFPSMKLIKVNLDDCKQLADRFHIDSTPTLFLGKDGAFAEYEGYRESEFFLKAIADLYYGRAAVNTSATEQKTSEQDISKQETKNKREARVRLNEDEEIVRTVREGLKAKNGYCPCRVQKTPENKCMCKEFREQIEDENFEGYCHCKLYYKEYV
ncbi:MAG: hypothetical protein II067_05425 [Agathobacter sp.]|uniref:thioredoxin family protein n=1 Tax=Agathobacter sp. TaxID=2021311 RepID=UPI00257E2202|nr:thioredoxin family protein [Agathobacter sp.]MBQ1681640.1 hypothetical protein [Agathobacter sp.]